MAPNALQASVCDEQLVSIGGEIALSGKKKKRVKKKEKVNNIVEETTRPHVYIVEAQLSLCTDVDQSVLHVNGS